MGNCLGCSVNKFHRLSPMYLYVHMVRFIYFNVTALKGFMPCKTSCLLHFYGKILTLNYVILS